MGGEERRRKALRARARRADHPKPPSAPPPPPPAAASLARTPLSSLSPPSPPQAGAFDGWTYAQIAAAHPDEFAARRADKLRYRYPAGESYMDVVQR